jgi:hypothetical protein
LTAPIRTCRVPFRYAIEDFVAVPIGAFADPDFPPPAFSVYEERMHGWVSVPGDVDHTD